MNVYTLQRKGNGSAMGDLREKAAERRKRTESVKRDNQTIEFFTREHGSGGKNKSISARVNSDTYQDFKTVCKGKGITPNACINMLISEFVHENKSYLDS